MRHVLVLLTVFSLAACDSTKSAPAPATKPAEATVAVTPTQPAPATPAGKRIMLAKPTQIERGAWTAGPVVLAWTTRGSEATVEVVQTDRLKATLGGVDQEIVLPTPTEKKLGAPVGWSATLSESETTGVELFLTRAFAIPAGAKFGTLATVRVFEKDGKLAVEPSMEEGVDAKDLAIHAGAVPVPAPPIMLTAGKPVEASWDDGVSAVQWSVADGTSVVITLVDDEPQTVRAIVNGTPQDLGNYVANRARGGSRVSWKLGKTGDLVLVTSEGGAGKDPGGIGGLKLRWDAKAKRVVVAEKWDGVATDKAPGWAE